LPGQAELARADACDEPVDAALEAILSLPGEIAEQVGEDGPRLAVKTANPCRQMVVFRPGRLDRAGCMGQPRGANDPWQLRGCRSADGQALADSRCNVARATIFRCAAAVRLLAGGGGRCLGCVDHSAKSKSIGTRESYPTLTDPRLPGR